MESLLDTAIQLYYPDSNRFLFSNWKSLMSKPSSPDQPRRKTKNPLLSLLAWGVALVLVTLVAIYIAYLQANRAPNLNIPTPSLPADNAFDDFKRAGKMADGMVHHTPSNMPGPPEKTQTFANYKAAALEFAPALAVVHQALSKPCQRPPVRSPSSISSIDFTTNSALRNLTRNIQGAGRYEQLAGHPLRAADIWLDGVEMAEMSEHGGELVDCITAVDGCKPVCLNRFEELLPLLDAGALRHVAVRLEEIQRKHVGYSDIVLEHGYSMLAGFQQALLDPTPGKKQIFASLNSARNLIQADSDKLPSRQEAFEITKYVLTDKQRMLTQTLNYYRAISEEAKRPYTGKSQVPVPDNFFINMYKVNENALNGRIHALRDEAVQALLRTEVALYRYKAEHHAYPDQLAALVPTYLPAVPADPFGGRPLRYQQKSGGSGFLLYSIGNNLIDDGGTPATNAAPAHEQTGDIVAGHLYRRSKQAAKTKQ